MDRVASNPLGGYTNAPARTDARAMNTTQEHGLIDTPVGDLSMRDAMFGMMGMAGPMGKAQQIVSKGALSGLQAMFGPYGVVGGSVAPEVGSDDFYSQTPALDHPLGFEHDAGAQAEFANEITTSPSYGQVALGAHRSPPNNPNANALQTTVSNPLDGLLSDVRDTISNALNPTPPVENAAFAQAMMEAGSGQANAFGPDPSRGANAGTSGGRGVGGGLGGGVGDVGAGNPGGTGVL
jgi:hypothetical protein